MTQQFPTRQVVAWNRLDIQPLEAIATGLAVADPFVSLRAMVLGVDTQPRAMRLSEVETFGDPFTLNILLKGTPPLTVSELVAAIDALTGEAGRSTRKVYVIAEGAALAAANPKVQINSRLAITWQKDNATPPDLLLSCTSELDDPRSLLQLIAWSETQGAYHFFERTAGAWAWAGNSFHALADVSRGKGPFDSHINGGLVMKELKSPWLHWHSQAAGIDRSLLFPGPLASNPLFANLEGAEVLERAVRTGIRRWTRRRVQNDLREGLLSNLSWYARQILWTTSMNLVSSEVQFSRLGQVEEFALPRTFFFDEDGLGAAAAKLDPQSDVLPLDEISIRSSLYRQAGADLALHVEDTAGVSIAGDTHFAFAVPERAFEDQATTNELLTREVLSPRLALCLLMVDFCNPVFSPARANLLGHFPAAIEAGNAGAALDAAILPSFRLAALAESAAAERELLALWDDQALLDTVRVRLAAFVKAVRTRLRTPDGARDLLRLAESRKEAFRNRKLNEFRHTTSRNGATEAHLAMREDATLFIKTADTGEKEK